MNPLTELIQTLSKKPMTSGVVISMKGSLATVSTLRGPQVYSIAINTPIKLGDKVAIINERIVARLTPDDSVPQFVV